MKTKLYIVLLFLIPSFLYSQEDTSIYEFYKESKLTYKMSPEELLRKDEIGKGFTVTDPPVGTVTNIAEFQPMQGVMIRYPLGIPVSLVKIFSELVKVTVVVSSNQQSAASNAFSNAGANMSNIEFLIAPSDSYWTRDYGPWFIIDGNDEFGIVDFPYNRPRPNDNNIASTAAGYYNTNLFGMNLIHTGGNYMTDGYHVSASTTLVETENSSLSLEQINQRMKDYLGIESYHLFEDPQGEYIEHIDCWGKFLGVDKILIARVAQSDPRYQVYEDIAGWFSNTTSPWGNKYRVHRVYAPGGAYQATPYTNSLILNDRVFVPQTGSAHDAAAIAVYEEAMPGYTIVPVMQVASTPWYDTDALHCRTREIADLEMLYIKHYPFLGELENSGNFDIVADITAYSGSSFVTDSMLIYYKINHSEWQTTLLEHQSGKQWKGTLSNLNNGDEVSYYLFAKDNSGRRECHPYIGQQDPHSFSISGDAAPEININIDAFNEISFTTDNPDFYFQITNTGNADLEYEINLLDIVKEGTGLLTFNPQAGTLISGNTDNITVTAHTQNIPAGIYNETIAVTSNAPDLPEVHIPVTITVYEGLMAPDTIWIIEKEENVPVFFTLSSDFHPELTLTSINTVFDGLISSADNNSLPLTFISGQEHEFKIEYTGSYTGEDTLYFDCSFITDKMIRPAVIAFVPKKGVGVEDFDQNQINLAVYPNPASHSITFSYVLDKPSSAIVTIFDITGKVVEKINQPQGTTGKQMINWDFNKSKSARTGVYFYVIKVDENIYSGKLLIVR